MKSIKIENLSFSYNKKTKIFSNFNLILESKESKGQITVLMGPSGSGKTTLLKLLLNIEKDFAGEISIYPDEPIISYVPQEAVLFEHLSLERNARYFQFAGKYKNKFNEQLFNELVLELGLKDVIENSKSINEISGGQKQRLSLLRALSIQPDFLLLDEPCNGLDADVKKSFLNKLREITEHYGLFVLYITHHKLEAQLIADDVVYLVQDKSTLIINSAIKASISQYLNKPPLLEAAIVFKFPNSKILPILKHADNSISLSLNSSDITNYWLIEDDNIRLDMNCGWKFDVVSKSPIYTVIKYRNSNFELMIPTSLLSESLKEDTVNLSIVGDFLTYDKNGILINEKTKDNK